MNQIVTIIITSILTSIFTNYFAFLKEKKVKSLSYTDESLKKIYIPIFKTITDKVIPGDGYEGIDHHQLDKIITIIKNNPEYADPELEKIVFRYEEDLFNEANRPYITQKDPNLLSFDENRELLEYILISFHRTRKSLGLPYNSYYANPIIYRIKNWKRNLNVKRTERKAEKLKDK